MLRRSPSLARYVVLSLYHVSCSLRCPEFNENTESTDVFEDENFLEIFRTIRAELKVEKTEPDPQQPEYPTIHFVGGMKDAPGMVMSGKVWMTYEGPRWRFVSGEAPNEVIWR